MPVIDNPGRSAPCWTTRREERRQVVATASLPLGERPRSAGGATGKGGGQEGGALPKRRKSAMAFGLVACPFHAFRVQGEASRRRLRLLPLKRARSTSADAAGTGRNLKEIRAWLSVSTIGWRWTAFRWQAWNSRTSA